MVKHDHFKKAPRGTQKYTTHEYFPFSCIFHLESTSRHGNCYCCYNIGLSLIQYNIWCCSFFLSNFTKTRPQISKFCLLCFSMVCLFLFSRLSSQHNNNNNKNTQNIIAQGGKRKTDSYQAYLFPILFACFVLFIPLAVFVFLVLVAGSPRNIQQHKNYK